MKKRRPRTLTVGGPPPGTREPPKVVQFAPTEKRRVFRKTIGQLVAEFTPWLSKIGMEVPPAEICDMIRRVQAGAMESGPAGSVIQEWVADEVKKGVTIVDDHPTFFTREVCEAFKQISNEEYKKIDQELEELLPDALFAEPIPANDLVIGQVHVAFQEAFPTEDFKWLSVTVDKKRAILTICSDKLTRTYLFDKNHSLKELFESVPHFDKTE